MLWLLIWNEHYCGEETCSSSHVAYLPKQQFCNHTTMGFGGENDTPFDQNLTSLMNNFILFVEGVRSTPSKNSQQPTLFYF